MNTEIFYPTKIIFGNNSSTNSKSFENLFKKNILIVTNNILKKNHLNKISKLLLRKKNKVKRIFIKDNEPIDTQINNNIIIYKKFDYLLALGGGSVIDFSKALCIKMSFPKKDIWDFTTHKTSKKIEIKKKLTPIIAIPTTAGTGSEVTPFCVIENKKYGKSTIKCKSIIPHQAIIDSVFLKSLPRKIRAYTVIDALAHSIESFLSKKKGKHEFVEMFASQAIILIIKNIKKYLTSNNTETLNHVARASTLAGMSISSGGTCAPHAFGQALTNFVKVPHGYSIYLFLFKILILTEKKHLKYLSSKIGFNILTEARKINNLIKLPKKIRVNKDIKKKIMKELIELRIQSIRKYPANIDLKRINKILDEVLIQ